MKKRYDSWREAKEAAEEYFPVRVTLAQPPGGFGDQYEAMMGWLDQQAGPQHYWVGGRAHPPALLIYFVDIAMAKAFVDRFVCAVRVRGDWPHTPPRRAVPAVPRLDSADTRERALTYDTFTRTSDTPIPLRE